MRLIINAHLQRVVCICSRRQSKPQIHFCFYQIYSNKPLFGCVLNGFMLICLQMGTDNGHISPKQSWSKMIVFFSFIFHIYMLSTGSVHHSYHEISFLQKFWFLSSGDLKWPPTRKIKDRFLPLSMKKLYILHVLTLVFIIPILRSCFQAVLQTQIHTHTSMIALIPHAFGKKSNMGKNSCLFITWGIDSQCLLVLAKTSGWSVSLKQFCYC